MTKTKPKKLRRVETKFEERPTVYILLYQQPEDFPFWKPLLSVHGAYSTEAKILAELKNLSKTEKLTKEQKKANAEAVKYGRMLPHKDPLDYYSIREIQVQ